jgi:uncharacterized membrane protein
MSSVYRARARQALGGIFDNAFLLLVAGYFVLGWLYGIAGSVTAGIGTLIAIGPMYYGLSYMHLKRLRSGQPVELSEAFSGLTNDVGRNIVTGLLVSLFTALWSLLFIIPGIVKYYSYSMTYYVSLDHPEYSSMECIQESERLMQGNKMELFCLDLSFIGWHLLGLLCFGVGTLWSETYREQAFAQFYQDLVTKAPYSQTEVH